MVSAPGDATRLVDAFTSRVDGGVCATSHSLATRLFATELFAEHPAVYREIFIAEIPRHPPCVLGNITEMKEATALT